MGNYFSLLWDTEEKQNQWAEYIAQKDPEYITDLNLEYLYQEVHKQGGYGESYRFENIFCYPCAQRTTLLYRQKIMEQLYENTGLFEVAEKYVEYMLALQKKIAQIKRMDFEAKREISFLQILQEFLTDVGNLYESLLAVSSLDGLEGLKELASCVVGEEGKARQKQLQEYLFLLSQAMAPYLILNKNREQMSTDVVLLSDCVPMEEYSEKLKKAAAYFLDEYDFSVVVYQDDGTCLDEKIIASMFSQTPELDLRTTQLYRELSGFDFSPFSKIARELIFYLSCIRFRQAYEKAGFPFCIPTFSDDGSFFVKGAYDLVLGTNLFHKGNGFQAVRNDYTFDDRNQFFVLTGANQGGKTTFVRSIGIIQCLAQTGMFVPAKKAVLGLAGAIYTHFSRDDESGIGQGRFERELQRLQKILKLSKSGDMILLNEPFTSTRRVVAVTLLKRILNEFHSRKCVGGIVTHYHEIMDHLSGEGFYSLIAGIRTGGDAPERTFRIEYGESYHMSYAMDIAVKCGAAYEQLLAIMKTLS